MKANINFSNIITTAWSARVIPNGSNIYFETNSNNKNIQNHNDFCLKINSK